MKLSELNPRRGTYVGVKVLDPSPELLYDHMIKNGLPVSKSYFSNKLHTTIIYSRKYCPDIDAIPTIKHVAQFSSYDIFDGQNGKNVLVMKLSAPSLTARHVKLMAAHEATYDYPTYQPHITLSYNYDSQDTSGITPFHGDIILGEEYVEDLDLDWNGK